MAIVVCVVSRVIVALLRFHCDIIVALMYYYGAILVVSAVVVLFGRMNLPIPDISKTQQLFHSAREIARSLGATTSRRTSTRGPETSELRGAWATPNTAMRVWVCLASARKGAVIQMAPQTFPTLRSGFTCGWKGDTELGVSQCAFKSAWGCEVGL